MHDFQRVRQAVADQFRSLGVSDQDFIQETFLIYDGCYCGRRFECGGFTAVWFSEENQVKYLNQQGAVVKTISTAIANFGQRQAA